MPQAIGTIIFVDYFMPQAIETPPERGQGHQNEFWNTLEYKLFEKMGMIWTPAKTMKKHSKSGAARGRQDPPGAARGTQAAARGRQRHQAAARSRQVAPGATPGTQAAARKLPASDPLDKNNVYWTCAPKNARDGCHSNFTNPRDPIPSILGTWTNFFSREKRFLHQEGDVIKPLEKCQVSQLLQTTFS